jgi:predicted flap endonuclease-1-like 5' DNA nuclease
MAWFLGQSLLVIVAAFLLGLLVGWLLWGRRRPRAAVEATGRAAVEATGRATVEATEPRAVVATEPAVETAPGPAPVEAAAPAGVIRADAHADAHADARAEADAEARTGAVEASVAEPRPDDEPPAPAAAQTPAAEADSETGTGATEPAGDGGATPAEVADDDLERIEGIGPRMAGALRAAGVRTFEELAGCDQGRLRAAIEAAGLSFAPSLVTWARQARLLADGDEAGFTQLTRTLVAGRDVTARDVTGLDVTGLDVAGREAGRP